ncbi:MAG: ferredoxin family protein [Deltaproteobacteria bacterium]|nr:ferredoxin family protein [Deltaproteobacteria bacterium]MBW2138094.1 ferredoxin family protein [Deltaproteobacteria bacterium]
MAIEKIDEARCTGCGICVLSCPMDVLRLDKETEKAVIRYPEDCMLCGWCTIECPEDAVTLTPEKASPLILSWG